MTFFNNHLKFRHGAHSCVWYIQKAIACHLCPHFVHLIFFVIYVALLMFRHGLYVIDISKGFQTKQSLIVAIDQRF